MSDYAEPATKAPPTPVEILGSTIQTLADKNDSLYSIVERVHVKLFGECIFPPEQTGEEAPDIPGGIAELTRSVEAILANMQRTILTAESLDNQA